MKAFVFAAGCLALFLLAFGQERAWAQNVVPNGDFEMMGRADWELTGNNTNAVCTMYDTSGNGQRSWCWKRRPGATSGNGGLKQDVCLFGGTIYSFSANLLYEETG